LGARVLRGYSDLADGLEQFTESRFSQANSLRQEFLRNLALPASITKVSTAFERIAKRLADRSLPGLPHQLLDWLDQLEGTPLAPTPNLSRDWRAWGNDDSRASFYAELAKADSQQSIERQLRSWLDRCHELVTKTEQFLSEVARKIDSNRTERDAAMNSVAIWGEWLDRRQKSERKRPSAKARTLAKQVKELQTQEHGVLQRGIDAKAHLDHLAQAKVFLEQTWLKDHEQECPTCGTDHSERGGIRKVIESLERTVGAERDHLRTTFANFKSQIEEIQKELGKLGEAQCPLSTDEQTQLARKLQAFIPKGLSLSDCIANKQQRESLRGLMKTVSEMPIPPAKVDSESEAQRFAQALYAQFNEAERVFEAPNNWKPVKDTLTKLLATIVQEHLPNTLARLWSELTLTLTAAPWLLPGQPSIGITARRGEQKATVQINDRLARYILNESEVHTLGLAWFFTRYLTHGRFFHSCIILDDPAHELDQTSFRDLCRLWETWIRLHRVYKHPLKFIVMLNQESRALDAARATGAMLAVLGWSLTQDESVRNISVIGEGFCAPQPVELLQVAASSSVGASQVPP
jgi:hypothetical protein